MEEARCIVVDYLPFHLHGLYHRVSLFFVGSPPPFSPEQFCDLVDRSTLAVVTRKCFLYVGFPYFLSPACIILPVSALLACNESDRVIETYQVSGNEVHLRPLARRLSSPS